LPRDETAILTQAGRRGVDGQISDAVGTNDFGTVGIINGLRIYRIAAYDRLIAVRVVARWHVNNSVASHRQRLRPRILAILTSYRKHIVNMTARGHIFGFSVALQEKWKLVENASFLVGRTTAAFGLAPVSCRRRL
jgi:hypothetical protein